MSPMSLTNKDRALTRKEGFVVCAVCEQSYPVGGYKLHAMQPWHIEHLSSTIHKAEISVRKKRRRDRLAFTVASYKTGMSMGDIGTMLGVSRQRIHQMLVADGVHIVRDSGNRTRTCFIDGQDYRFWREHSEGVAHKTAEEVIVGHLRTSPYTKSKGNQ
jgi:hypothetical protein